MDDKQLGILTLKPVGISNKAITIKERKLIKDKDNDFRIEEDVIIHER